MTTRHRTPRPAWGGGAEDKTRPPPSDRDPGNADENRYSRRRPPKRLCSASALSGLFVIQQQALAGWQAWRGVGLPGGECVNVGPEARGPG